MLGGCCPDHAARQKQVAGAVLNCDIPALHLCKHPSAFLAPRLICIISTCCRDCQSIIKKLSSEILCRVACSPQWMASTGLCPTGACGVSQRRGCPLLGLHATPSLDAHERRLTGNGWSRARATDLDTVYRHHIDPAEKRRSPHLLRAVAPSLWKLCAGCGLSKQWHHFAFLHPAFLNSIARLCCPVISSEATQAIMRRGDKQDDGRVTHFGHLLCAGLSD